MRVTSQFFCAVAMVFASAIFSSFNDYQPTKTDYKFPWKEAGLTERQAAAHLLSRFTFGARPGDVDAVINTGLEKWFQQQLDAGLADDELNDRLSEYDALKLTNSEVVNTYPRRAQILKMAIKDGAIDKDSINKADKELYKSALLQYMQQKGFKPERELFRQFANQKILRAAYSNNQLQELLTDFWFNHFNVSITKNDCAEFIPAYERDVIRPNALGKFEDLLMATAKSPAMLLYLDNFSSSGTNSDVADNGMMRKMVINEISKTGDSSNNFLNKLKNKRKSQGLNENYAREVMELHTLGVDGGYTQNDVTQAARVLTGWTVYPISDYGPANAIRKVIERVGEDKLLQRGFVHDGDFLFAANRHDNGDKTVLGKSFNNNGYDEGVELLKMLAHHLSTAAFISRKLAVRFVSDNPPQSLVNKMAKTFIARDGDIKQVLVTMASSPEFWNKDAIRAKTKSPFEMAISAVRSLNADIKMPYQLYNWIDKMGQKMYYYQAPTGFPDKGQYWINTGSLLNRMNFGLALASQRIPGITIDLLALNNGHEPESAEAALLKYSKIVMPERNLDQTIKRLTPLLHDPELDKKIDQAADKSQPTDQTKMIVKKEMNTDEGMPENTLKKGAEEKKDTRNMMAQVVGIIIGSPEFQRK